MTFPEDYPATGSLKEQIFQEVKEPSQCFAGTNYALTGADILHLSMILSTPTKREFHLAIIPDGIRRAHMA